MIKNITKILAIILAKTIIKVCRLFNYGGTALAGGIARKIYPNILSDLAKGFYIVMVTGTNGKTTTTKMISQILKCRGAHYITNNSGANLTNGIITTFIYHVKLSKDYGEKAQIAVLEVDEAAFCSIVEQIEPNILVVTNFFRDQLDRYGELYTTISRIKDGLGKTKNTKLVLNADDSLCVSLIKDLKNREIVYYGTTASCNNLRVNLTDSDAEFCIYCKNRYEYSYRTYGHLGGFVCNNCGYKRPLTHVTCTKIESMSSMHSEVCVAIDKDELHTNIEIKINIPGMYNIYNSLAATACAVALRVDNQYIINALENYQNSFGRMEVIKTEKKDISLILVKNPTGFDQVLDLILNENANIQIAFVINDNSLDGVDISWLWDVRFEKLKDIQNNITKMYVAGTRAEDMLTRLKYADLNVDNTPIIKDYKQLIDTVICEAVDTRTLYILHTYTAMLAVRKVLETKFALKEFWK